MGNEINNDLISSSVIETLEEGAFIFAEATEESPPWSDDEIWETRLSYSAHKEGEVYLATISELAVEIATNLLGLDSEVPEASDKAADAVGEILNVIAGTLFDRWFGNDVEYSMGVPEVKKVSVEEHEEILEKSSCSVSMITEDGLRIDVAVV